MNLQSIALPLGYTVLYILLVMIKLKTRKSVIKRIKVKGKLLIHKKVNKRHLLRKKNSMRLSRLSRVGFIHSSDASNIFTMIPYYN